MRRSSDGAGGNLESRRQARRRIVRREERRSELLVAGFRAGLCVIGAALLLGFYPEMPGLSLRSGLIVAGSAALYSLLLLVVILARGYQPWMKYFSVAVDVVSVTVLLWLFDVHRTLKSPATVLYFVVVVLAAFRFSARLTIVAGALSGAAYAGLLAATAVFRPVPFGSLAESFESSLVSASDTITRIVYLAALASICAAIAFGYRRIMRSSALHEIQAARERRERARMRDMLTRYMTEQVADVVLKSGGTLSGESRRATVLFCDIRDFTRLSGGLAPVDVVALLNEVLSRLVDVVFDFGGTLDKFLGDGLMAVFGAPLSSGRDEEMAVRSAVRMREEMDRLNAGRAEQGLPGVRIGIGIHSGDVVAGSIGSLRRLEYTVIGSTVNLASRIEQLNKTFKTDILISSATYERVTHLVETEPEPLAQVRGVTGEVSTYRLISVKDFPDKRVGEELMRIGAMTTDQVHEVLRRQQEDHRFFGEIAVDLGFITREKLGMFLAAVKHSREGEAAG